MCATSIFPKRRHQWEITIMKYRNNRNGEPISILGYGCMRFTTNGRGIDIDKAEKELMEAYNQGVNYFDTAYVYSGSEAALGEILERNNIRDKVNIATKLPQYLIGSRAAVDRYFEEELRRLRTDHVEYYLMHHMKLGEIKPRSMLVLDDNIAVALEKMKKIDEYRTRPGKDAAATPSSRRTCRAPPALCRVRPLPAPGSCRCSQAGCGGS